MLSKPFAKKWIIVEIFLLIVISVVPYVSEYVKIALAAALCIFSVVTGLRKTGEFRFALSFLLIMLFFAVSAVLDVRNITPDNPYSIVNLMYPFYFLCGYFCAQKWTRDEVYDAIEKITFILALCSFVGMAIIYVAPALVLKMPTYRYNDMTHRTMYITNFIFSDNWMSPRNCGIAWEPGVFQILLNVALQVSIRKKKGKSLFVRVLIYVIAIVLTRSTMGFIVLAINLISLVLKDRRYIVLMVCAGFACAPFIVSEFAYQTENKLAGSKSFAGRYDPLVNAFNYTWYRPFGLGSTRYNMEYQALHLGSYDSYTQILLRYGFVTLLCIGERLFKIFRRDGIWMCLILAVSFFSEPVWGSILSVVLFYVKEKEQGVEISGE